MIIKINGYDLYKGFGIMPSSDRATTDSFEIPNDPKPAFSHDWGGEDGIEVDVVSPVVLAPRVFTISGTLLTNNKDDYQASKGALTYVLYESYVTIEIPDLDIKVNARIKPGGNIWKRLTQLDSDVVAAQVQFKFDELMQSLPYKDEGQETITYLVDSQVRYYNTQDNKFMIL